MFYRITLKKTGWIKNKKKLIKDLFHVNRTIPINSRLVKYCIAIHCNTENTSVFLFLEKKKYACFVGLVDFFLYVDRSVSINLGRVKHLR